MNNVKRTLLNRRSFVWLGVRIHHVLHRRCASPAFPIPFKKKEQSQVFQKKVVIIGSSLAAGWVTSREGRYDFQNGFAQRLGRLLAERGFDVVNVSVPGDSTRDVLDRLEKDLFPHQSGYCHGHSFIGE